MTRTVFAASALAALLLAATVPTADAQVFTLDNRAAALKGADRLLSIQNPDGSFPWQVGNPTPFQNVQGITAIGLLEAYKLSLDARYLAGAKANRDWLEAYRNGASPPRLLSAPNVYFIAEYAALSGQAADFDLARAIIDQRLAGFGGPEGVADTIIAARKAQGHTNLGLWDVSLYARAAQDVGHTAAAQAIAKRMMTQTMVDPYASSANWYEIGLTGVILALTEVDLTGNLGAIQKAATALKATQAADGSFPVTFGGIVYPGDVQVTAYAAMALVAAADPVPALDAADFLRSVQAPNGGFPAAIDDPTEYGEQDAEAVGALVATALPVPNGALAYADAAKAFLPPGRAGSVDPASALPGVPSL